MDLTSSFQYSVYMHMHVHAHKHTHSELYNIWDKNIFFTWFGSILHNFRFVASCVLEVQILSF